MVRLILTIVEVLLLVCSSSATRFSIKSDSEIEDVGEIIVTLTVPSRGNSSSEARHRSGGSSLLHDNEPMLLAHFSVPKLPLEIDCLVFANNGFIPADFNVTVIGETNDDNNNQTIAQDWGDIATCHYTGMASFIGLPFTSKCMVNLCGSAKTGIIWLPRDAHFLMVSAVSDQPVDDQHHNKTTFTAHGYFNGDDLFNMTSSPTSEARSGLSFEEKLEKFLLAKFKPKHEYYLRWMRALVKGHTPTRTHHLRVIAVIPTSAYYSPFLGRKPKNTATIMASVFSLVNAIFAQVNISVYLTEVVIYANATNRIVGSFDVADNWSNASKVLIDVQKFVEAKIWPTRRNADFAVIIHKLNDSEPYEHRINGMTAGMTASICKGTSVDSANGAVAVVRTIRAPTLVHNILDLGLTIAHEITHAFGVSHDDLDVQCNCLANTGGCLMARQTDSWIMSNCSMYRITDYLQNLPPLCFKQIPEIREMNVPSLCGNGFVESGEECDCGPVNEQTGKLYFVDTLFCPNPKCCNVTTCKLVKNATCATGSCCEPATCSFANNTKLCRPERSSNCDFAEFCSGNSSQCPADRYLMSGTPCDFENEGSCYEGQCLTRNGHCQTIIGGSHLPMSEARSCYLANMDANETANCGHNWFRSAGFNNSIEPCEFDDIECGNIMCSSYKKSGKKKGWYAFSGSFAQNESCYSVAGKHLPDFGHVPDGMLCQGGARYCLKQRCVGEIPRCQENLPCDNFGQSVWQMKPDDGNMSRNSTIPGRIVVDDGSTLRQQMTVFSLLFSLTCYLLA